MENFLESRREQVVAIEVGDAGAQLFFHDSGAFRSETIPFKPFLWLSEAEQLAGCEAAAAITPLEGSQPLKFLAEFSDPAGYESALKFLKQNSKLPYTNFRDLRQQALAAGDIRLFTDMEFAGLRRLALAWDCDDAGRLTGLELADSSGWTQRLEGSEHEIVAAFARLVAERDPDVIEGHNLCREGLPLLEAKARYTKARLALGRDGSAPSKRPSRFALPDRQINYTRYEVYGRHVVDTMHLAQFYDAVHRDLESAELDDLANHFHLEGEGARLVNSLAGLLCPSYFYQTAFFPLTYQEVIVRGNGSTLDALLVTEYYRLNHSLPLPEAARNFQGALTRAEAHGVFRNVWHCDVRSLYPSIILAEKWTPKRDELGVFPRTLAGLRNYRLEAKDKARRAATPEERRYWNTLQSVFKITINSFYGYLGFAQGSFNDYDMAEQVTARGRAILESMLAFLNGEKAEVIEMDTDGIYFVPPAGAGTPEEFQKKIQQALPPGIDVELDATYEAMFSYKSKNYALLTRSGDLEITGAALKSRGLEPFQRDFIAALTGMLLRGENGRIEELYAALRRQLENHELPLARLAKTETLNDSPENYQRKLAAGTGRRSAAYELVLKAKQRRQAGDKVTYYLTGSKPKPSVVDSAKLLADAPENGERDENVAAYLYKLDELYKNFRDFL